MTTKKKPSKGVLIPSELKIKVTKKDIAEGTMNDATYCPIGRAVQRLGYNADDIEVESDGIRITFNVFGKEVGITYNADVIDDFVEGFDAGEEVEPLSFVAVAR